MPLPAEKLRQCQLSTDFVSKFDNRSIVFITFFGHKFDGGEDVFLMKIYYVYSSQGVVNALQTNDCPTTNVNVFFENGK